MTEKITTILDRIEELIKVKGLSNRAFSMSVGTPPMTLSSMFKRRSDPSALFVATILSVYPDVSSDWLLSGKGPMLKSESPIIPRHDDNSVSYKLVPLLNLDAVGGMHSLNTVSDGLEYTETLIPFTDAQEGDIALIVSGNSMDPTCPAGSKILLREVKNWREYFGFGNIFVIQLIDNRRILKEVRKYPEDSKNYILCKSHNDKYPEEELPKSMIKSVWKVIKILNERGW